MQQIWADRYIFSKIMHQNKAEKLPFELSRKRVKKLLKTIIINVFVLVFV